MDVDLAIIGSGGGAFAAAIAARRAGRSVVMVERGTVGGTCVNTGCIPSKALLAAADARHVALNTTRRFPGIRTGAEEVDFAELIAGKAALVADVRAEKYVDLAATYGWDILHGEARFVAGPEVQVELTGGACRRVEAEHYLVATGSAPWMPLVDGLADLDYLTSSSAMELAYVPESMLVIGGGYVGLEQAQLFARLGTEVTVVARSRLASAEEPEISAGIEAVFTDEGITVHTAGTVAALRRQHGQIIATLIARDSRRQEIRTEQLLMATGRRPVTDGLGLEDVGVKVGERGEIVTDDHLRTANPRVWAAGDVTGRPQFIYVAGAHGALVVDNAFHSTDRTLNYHHLPRVTFTGPSIAAVGLTEAQAREQGVECDCRVLPLDYVPRALVNRNTRGLVKLVAERSTGQLLGAHVLAEGAGDVIATAVYALHQQMTVHEMAELWCPYLTMAESLKLAAQTFTRDVSKLSCCAS